MSDSVRTKLQASASGQAMRKRQSPKRKKSKKQEQAQKPTVEIKETVPVSHETQYETASIEETANVLFKPNPGPQTDFLPHLNVKFYMVAVQVVVSHMPCLLTHCDIWGIHSLVD
jgi:hypothetical protein